MRRSADSRDEIHKHSGWLIPLGLLLVILALCGLFLLYYLRPGTGLFRNSGPTADSTVVSLTVRGVALHIPSNYLEARLARRGGDFDIINLFALLPDLRGYSGTESGLFTDNAADSPLLHLLLRGDTNGLAASDRLARIYMPYVTNPRGAAGDFGLTRYGFRADSGYGRNDLFAGDNGAGLLLLLCERPAQDLPSPNCIAIDRPVAHNVNLSYRFKRSQLSHWREISGGANRLIAGFLKR